MKNEMSDFSKLTSRTAEENNKPKIKFKIVPPPPKPKAEPPPPPPSARKTASSKPHRPKRKVEVDVIRLCWKESWMSLKPPKYLYLKAKELKTQISGFTTIKLTDNRKYKAKVYGSEAELTFRHDKWSNSWKQVLIQIHAHSFMVKHTKNQNISLIQHVLGKTLEPPEYL